MKFWANKNNYLKHLANLLAQYNSGIEHGNTVGDVVNDKIDKGFPDVVSDTIISFVTYRITDVYRNSDNVLTAVYSDSISKDSVIKKSQIGKFKKLHRQQKLKHKQEIDDLLRGTN